MKRVSVIIPVYNTEQYLKQCLDSVINQTYMDIEVVIINDGSTDNSTGICEEYARGDSRIIYLSTDNQGQGMARNLGLENATGEYIMFVDSDDFLDYDAITNFVHYIDKQDADICGFDYYLFDEKLQKDVDCANHDVVFVNAVGVKDNPEMLGQMSPVLCSKIIKRDLIRKARISMENYMCEDLLFLAQLYSEADRVSQIRYAGYHYRYDREGNISTNTTKYYEVEKSVYKLNRAFVDKGLRNDYWRELYQLSFNIFKDFLFRLNGKRAMLQAIDSDQYKSFLCKYYDALQDLFEDKIDLSMMKKKYLIVGSYNLRTIVHTALFEESNIVEDYSASTVESIVSEDIQNKLIEEAAVVGDNRYRKRQVRQDVEKTLKKTIDTIDAEVILIDLLEEVHGIMAIDRDSYLTDSEYLPKYFRDCMDNYQYISFLSESRDAIFDSKAKDFCRMINEKGIEVIVMENYLCEEHSNVYDERTEYSNSELIRKCNEKLASYYDILESMLPGARIISDAGFSKYRFTLDEWPFGCRPYYYNNTYCRLMAIEICKRV